MSITISELLSKVPTGLLIGDTRRLVLHLPQQWRWEPQWSRLFDHTHSPPASVPA